MNRPYCVDVLPYFRANREIRENLEKEFCFFQSEKNASNQGVVWPMRENDQSVLYFASRPNNVCTE